VILLHEGCIPKEDTLNVFVDVAMKLLFKILVCLDFDSLLDVLLQLFYKCPTIINFIGINSCNNNIQSINICVRLIEFL